MDQVDAAQTLRFARARAGLSLRELAARAKTSHSTLAAYEAGHKAPSLATLERIVRAAGFELESALLAYPDVPAHNRGRELIEVLELAAMFPAKHNPTLEYPKFTPR